MHFVDLHITLKTNYTDLEGKLADGFQSNLQNSRVSISDDLILPRILKDKEPLSGHFDVLFFALENLSWSNL